MSKSNQKMYIALMGAGALILQVVALSTNYWSIQSGSSLSGISRNFKQNVGLWKTCTQNNNKDNCYKIKDASHAIEAARAFAIMGAAFVLLGLLSMSKIYPMKKKHQAGLLALGGICSIIAMGVWVGEELQGGKPGYSLYLNSIGALLALLAAYGCYM